MFYCMLPKKRIMLLIGNFLLREAIVKYTPEVIGNTIRQTRKSMQVTQKDLALTSGTGLRFIIDLEKGKPTCQLGKVLTVLHTLGITLELNAPGFKRNAVDENA